MGEFLPQGVDPGGAAVVVAASVLTSGLTAAVGIGGGVLLLAFLSFVIPPEALIPVHAVAQLGSNTGRAALLARHVSVPAIVPFLLAAALGVAAGALIVSDLPPRVLIAIIGIFVLLTTWTTPPSFPGSGRIALVVGGFAASVLTMMVGATGPFIIAIIRQVCPAHVSVVATHAAAMTAQHGLKVIAFTLIGFAFVDYVPLLAAIIAAGFLGTLGGTRVLFSIPEKALKSALKWTLTLIAAQLLVRAAFFMS